MSNNVNIHFKCEGQMYSLMLKTSVEEITLSMIEARIYKKLALDESKVKLQLSYYPLLVGCLEQFTISDDEDVCVYLTSIDKENRRCILFVEIITISELPEQLSRAGKSSFGMNYDELHSNDGETGANAITLYVEKEPHEAIVDATFLKNGYGGVLIFATAQDPNRHYYPISFGVLDGDNDASWTWFFEMLKTVIPDSSELVFMSDRNARLISAIANVYPEVHHGYCIWHLSQNVKGHASNVNKDVVAYRFMECSRHYTVAEFNSAYTYFKMRYPSAAKYLEESTEKEKWARCCFPGEIYNLDTSNCVESLNSVFKDARRYSLIPMLDTIIKTFSNWFNEHRKEAVSGSISNKLVPFVENCMHDLWAVAEKLIVTELNTFELEINVIGSDGKPYLVNLLLKSCCCRVFDIERYPCVQTLAAYIDFLKHDDRGRDIQLHELCSKYYWTELWAMAYYKTIYLVPDRSQWDVPYDIKSKQIIPPDRKVKTGRKKVKRFPSAGERRPRTQNKRRPRQGLHWLLYGNHSYNV